MYENKGLIAHHQLKQPKRIGQKNTELAEDVVSMFSLSIVKKAISLINCGDVSEKYMNACLSK